MNIGFSKLQIIKISQGMLGDYIVIVTGQQNYLITWNGTLQSFGMKTDTDIMMILGREELLNVRREQVQYYKYLEVEIIFLGKNQISSLTYKII